MLTRRRFSYILGFLFALPSFIISACKKAVLPSEYAITADQSLTLASVHEHLFPSDNDSPGAKDINSVGWIKKILRDPQISIHRKQLLVRGILWTEETAQELFKKDFNTLTFDEKEAVLQNLKEFKNSERWLSVNLTYILEALLADPIYEVNTNQTGWNWLKHQTGFPRPTSRTKYQYL